MDNDWGMARIEEVAEKVAMGPFGSSIKVETFVQEGVPIISGQHLHGFRVDDSPGFNFITAEHAERLANANVQRGDIVFTHAGNISNVAYVAENSEFERYVVSQRQFYVRCDRAKIIPEFMTAYFKTPDGQHQLLANSSQVGVPSIAQPVSYLRTIEIPLPPLPEQRRIAGILGALDDKIDLNHRMNETLEQIARALYKSWFVDFDPVHAKMDGRWQSGESLPGLPAQLYDLFPDRLLASVLGEIPEGWEVNTIGDLATIIGGSTPSTKIAEYWESGTHYWATPKDLSELTVPVLLETSRKITDAGLAKIGSGLQPPGTVLLSSRAPVGYLAINEVPTAINQGFIAIKPKAGIPNHYLLHWCANSLDEILNYANGSTFLEISKSSFRLIQLATPDHVVLKAYDALASNFHQKIVDNEQSNRILISIRDSLLPELISGALRVRGSQHA